MIYKDSDKPIEERVEDLMNRMTLIEKVAQLTCHILIDDEAKDEKNCINGIGTISFLNSTQFGDTKKDMNALQKIQQYLVEKTRLGIPALAHNEGIAGAQIPGATTFPQSIGAAAAWEPELIEKMAEVVKRQLLAFGFRAVHSPLFDLGRDPRWGRIGETYGEDPYLTAQMGTAYVKGVQGEHELMSSAKHFAGYGNTEGGRNSGEQQMSDRKLLDTYCFPFESAIHDGGIMAVMNSYGFLNDESIVTSKRILTDILRDKLGFEGLVVADYGSIELSYTRHHTADSIKTAAILALKAGLDVEQPYNNCYKYLVEAVESGELDEKYIDRAVSRVLYTKFKLGLFENPYTQGDFIEEISKPENKKLSLDIAEKSIVMVKNDDMLPLKKNKKIALIGPSADCKLNFFGGYSSVSTASTSSKDFDRSEHDAYFKMAYNYIITHNKDALKERGIVYDDKPSEEQKKMIIEMLKMKNSKSNKAYQDTEEFLSIFYPDCKTVKEVLEEEYGSENIIYTAGCGIRNSIEGGIEGAISAAGQSDIVIAVLGGRESMRDREATCGENRDNTNIGLEQPQIELMEAVSKSGKPIVTIIIDGRPLSIPSIDEMSKAVLYAWLPAECGGEAIVNILSGKVSPSGKLPVTIVRDKGQIPMYNSRLGHYEEADIWAEYIDNSMNAPLYNFGHGLSYSKFEYSDFDITPMVAPDGMVKVSFKVKNIGLVQSDEVAQIYARDVVSSVARPLKQLVGFKRLNLKPSESKEITVILDMKQFAFHNIEMKQVVEPGVMEIYVGSSSKDIRLKGSFEIAGDVLEVERKVFSSKIMVSGSDK